MVDRAFNLHADQVTGPPSYMSLTMKSNWEVRYGKQDYIEPAYTSFITGGCISIDAFVNALAARAARRLNLVVVDLRELATQGKEGNIKVAGALEAGMENVKPSIADFEKFKTQYPALFPANQGALPEAVIFYCAQGHNRSPAMAVAYKLWMYQTFELELQAHAPIYHVCFLTGGYDAFIKANITIQNSWGLLEAYSQVATPLSVSNVRGARKESIKR